MEAVLDAIEIREAVLSRRVANCTAAVESKREFELVVVENDESLGEPRQGRALVNNLARC
jgi:hypothetical protein